MFSSRFSKTFLKFFIIFILLIFPMLQGCAGVQKRVVNEADKQASVVVFTPEQTQMIRDMAQGQLPKECPTAVGTFVKNTAGKVTLLLRCE